MQAKSRTNPTVDRSRSLKEMRVMHARARALDALGLPRLGLLEHVTDDIGLGFDLDVRNES